MKLQTDLEREAIRQGLDPLLAMGLSDAALLAYVKAKPRRAHVVGLLAADRKAKEPVDLDAYRAKKGAA